jgi:hypothetical protein
MNEFLPMVRCGPELKLALEKIAAQSVSPRLSDHIRFAVEQYVERELPKMEAGGKEEPVNVRSN